MQRGPRSITTPLSKVRAYRQRSGYLVCLIINRFHRHRYRPLHPVWHIWGSSLHISRRCSRTTGHDLSGDRSPDGRRHPDGILVFLCAIHCFPHRRGLGDGRYHCNRLGLAVVVNTYQRLAYFAASAWYWLCGSISVSPTTPGRCHGDSHSDLKSSSLLSSWPSSLPCPNLLAG